MRAAPHSARRRQGRGGGAGERFQKFADARAPSEPALPAAAAPATTPGGLKSEAAVSEQMRRDGVQKQLDATAASLAKASPTAAALLDKFKKEGGVIVDGRDGGFFQGGKPPVIGLNTEALGRQTTAAQREQTLAHELGHYQYSKLNQKSEVRPANGLGGKTDAQMEARRDRDYTLTNRDRQLADEAHATQVNAQIRDEVKANTGRDIGVAGIPPGAPVPTRAQLIEQYAALTPSGQEHLPPEKRINYNEHYSKGYREHYSKYYTPGGPGNLW